MNDREAVAAIRIVGAVARADGRIDAAETLAMRSAIAEFNPTLPDGSDVERLLSEDVDLDAELAVVRSPVVQRAVFETAVAMSLVDGSASAQENQVLTRIRAAFNVGREASTGGFALAGSVTPVTTMTPILDPAERAKHVSDLIARRSVWAGALGALPVPIVSDIGVFHQIDTLVRGIAMAWGHPLTRKESWAQFGAVLGMAFAQSAVHSLLKLLPGLGSVAGAIGGGLSGFVITRAVGMVVNQHFEREGKTTPEELRALFKDQKTAAKIVYEASAPAIEDLRASNAEAITALGARLEKKEITPAEFNAKLLELTKG